MILKSFTEKRIRFAAIRNTRHRPSEKEFRQYRVRIEIGLIAVLVTLIVLFSIFRRRSMQSENPPLLFHESVILLDEVPVTHQGRPRTAPSRPVVPIPDENELLPEDMTVGPELFAAEAGVPLLGKGGAGDSHGGEGEFLPRPIREAVPEFPESDRAKGVRGVVKLHILVNARGRVDSVQVVQNTTGSRKLAQAVKDAAYQSLYRPPGGALKGQSCWITRPYRFESD